MYKINIESSRRRLHVCMHTTYSICKGDFDFWSDDLTCPTNYVAVEIDNDTCDGLAHRYP